MTIGHANISKCNNGYVLDISESMQSVSEKYVFNTILELCEFLKNFELDISR